MTAILLQQAVSLSFASYLYGLSCVLSVIRYVYDIIIFTPLIVTFRLLAFSYRIYFENVIVRRLATEIWL
jgi:hypothetical protein